MNRSIDFFSRQFAQQIARADYALNPFETRALPYLQGSVLDLGCGLGNLAFAAARSGADVVALDASEQAIDALRARARAAGLRLQADAADLAPWRADRQFDCVVSIGLLMFLPCPAASTLLDELKRATRPGGLIVLNVLVEGTTYVDMFDPAGFCLFAADDVRRRFDGWPVIDEALEDFPAGDKQRKRFITLIARRPGGS
jgi:tellurite methyltransferase